MRTKDSRLHRPFVFLALLLLISCSASALVLSPVEGQVVYVDCNAPGPEHNGNTWDTAFLTIQAGVNDADAQDEQVWVADGAYVENVVMGHGIAIYGGFLGAEEGGYEEALDQRDWVNHVATIDGNQSGTCVKMDVGCGVDGFTITNGKGERHGNYGLCGGGIFCLNLGDSAATIANNVITGNWAGSQEEAGMGGGIYCYSSSPTIAHNTVEGNNAKYYGGGIAAWVGSSPTIVSNVIRGNRAGFYANAGGGGVACAGASAVLANNIIVGNHGYRGGGVQFFRCQAAWPAATNNTIMGNSAEYGGGGLDSDDSKGDVSNNVVVQNHATRGGGIYVDGTNSPRLFQNDFWGNTGGDYYGCNPGAGDISEDPLFENPGSGDFHLRRGSPCIDAGDNGAPGLPETDFEGDPRILDGDGDGDAMADMGADEVACVPTTAPDPEPYCPGALFGEPASGFPGWVWFSIPLDPDDCCDEENCYDPNVLLGFTCSGKVWYWDRYGKTAQVYQPPFLQWDFAVGDSYLLYLESNVENPGYYGRVPDPEFAVRLGRQGWTWAGKPGPYELGYTDFMNNVLVQYPVGGMIRTAGEDYASIPNNWVSWGWSFWDTYNQAPRTFAPYLPFGNNTCYPWIGYRLWVNVGAAVDEEDPDQVTLIWP